MKKKEIITIVLYLIIIIIGIIISYLLVHRSKNKLSKEEKNIYESMLIAKNDFKNPKSIKILSVKYCSDDYSIIRITANNSFGAAVTDDYFKNKNVVTTSSAVAKIVSEECFKNELENYDNVKKLSKESLIKINKKLIGAE